MTRPFAPRRWLSQVLLCGGIAGLAVISMVHPGTSRMYAWPWSLGYAAANIAPLGLLLLRIANRRRPLITPGRAWLFVAALWVGAVVASAVSSPYPRTSLQWALPLVSAVAVFLVFFDAWHADPDGQVVRRRRILTGIGLFLSSVALASVAYWLTKAYSRTAADVLNIRNPYTLGHSNYTAGLALLMLPAFGLLSMWNRGWKRLTWALMGIVALGLLFTSGSRGGLGGLGVLAVAFIPTVTRTLRIPLWLVAAGSAVILIGLLTWNPRLRAMISMPSASAEPNLSTLQRGGTIKAGWRMGVDRPIFGWGPGTTPLIFPRYRGGVDQSTENVLQLHSAPVHVWAELGSFGIMAGIMLAGLAVVAARHSANARFLLLALSGYTAFSLTDWQLDVPIIGFSVAIAVACMAGPGGLSTPLSRIGIGATALVVGLAIALLGHPDPTFELNLRALTIAREPANASAAIPLFKKSLAYNPHQEIAHFNLGWLLLVRDPVAAEEHFLAAARLVPDKGGVYFGIGLARLNQGDRARAVRALAIECVNDPIFLTSPWWQLAPLGELRQAHADDFIHVARTVAAQLAPRDDWFAREAAYTAALTEWLLGKPAPGEILARALTPERVSYFARRPPRPDFDSSIHRTYRRERTGYPVLMRNHDLPAPIDLYDVKENVLAHDTLGFLFPRKGWAPGPVLLRSLEMSSVEK